MIKLHLKALAAERGITQKAISEQTGVRLATLSAMNHGKVKHIPLDVLEQLCAVLDCQPGDLLEYVPEKE